MSGPLVLLGALVAAAAVAARSVGRRIGVPAAAGFVASDAGGRPARRPPTGGGLTAGSVGDDRTVTEPTALDRSLDLPGGGRIPLLGFGTWQLTDSAASRAVGWALEAGYRHLDTATQYGNEAEVGAAIAAAGVPRSELFLTTKIPPHLAGDWRRTLESSLAGLGTDHVDLWLIHWPPRDGGAAPELWEHLVAAREEGLARAVGVSNYSAEQIDALAEASGVRPAVNQIEWSPFRYDPAVVEAHRTRGVVLEGYSPFQASRMDDPVLVGIAERHGVTPAQVIIRWHLQHEVVVIPKSAHRERIEANAAVDGFVLGDTEMVELDELAGS